ncbi:MAG: glycolate oxidase binding subunit [Pseudonocardiales bacterium]|jgi:glycolate oxidase FAD binding subunit|nr:glycolate oxidase binding subunit [Pseudonocardiales bacterium]
MSTPTPTSLRPEDVDGVRTAVLDTAGPIAIAGAGTAADWAGPLGAVDAVLDTTALTGVITHNPGDMTVSVRAGTPLRALVEELAPHGQHVSFDAARVADGATVGGLLATADAGPSALIHGLLRDLVIGTTLVLADGTIAHSGGHVIKNVAGFDLSKLVHGSYGTLAVVAEVVLRLHPVAKATATLALDCPLAEAPEHAARVLGGPYEPVALEWVGESAAEGTLLVRIEGTEAALRARVDRLSRVIGTEGGAARPTDGWDRHAALVRGTDGSASLRVGSLPSRLPSLIASLPAVTGITAGLGTGVATVSLDPAGVAEAHALVHAAGGTSVVRSRPAGADVPSWGPPPSAIAVLKSVKNALDPQDRFGPGRFDPWM